MKNNDINMHINTSIEDVIDTSTKQDDYIAILKQHFPSLINQLDDGSYVVNKEQLQLMLEPKNCKIIDDGFGLNWVGKKEAYYNAYIQNNKILKPLVDQSRDFDNTSNILIKGDNLDALKLLRKNYFEKIKMIYIDPPYNTENDGFIYNDNFTKSQEQVLDELGYSAEQKEYIKNIAGAKTHSGWLSFMYPRLLLARDLLRDDGVIFISIDDKEHANLKLLCDEVFGQENVITNLIRKIKSTTNDASSGINIQHDYVLVCAKSKIHCELFGTSKSFEHYKNPDNDINGNWVSGDPTAIDDGRKTKNTKEIINPYTGKIDVPGVGRRWRFNEIGFNELVASGKIVFKKIHKEHERSFIFKRYQNEIVSDYNLVNSILYDNKNLNQAGTKLLNKMFGVKIFDNPKPIEFLKFLSMTSTKHDDIILDFFSGSGTTADAVMQLNVEDGGNRKYILVQLPELIDSKKSQEAYNFVTKTLKKEPTIFEITAERLRRAGDKIKAESQLLNQGCNLDLGFKVYEITNDTYHDIYTKPLQDVTQEELSGISNISKLDSITILTNLLLGSKITLDVKIEQIIADCLYKAEDSLFIIKEFALDRKYFINIEYVTVYARHFTDDNFLANLSSYVNEDKLSIKG
jgi:adenine-specific DNA-methyltransferase